MTTDAVGGVWTYSLDLARELVRRGVSVVLACIGPLPRSVQLASLEPSVELRTLPCRLEWMDDPWADVDRSTEWLARLEREVHPDVVHVNGYAHAAAPFRAPSLAVAHSCVLSWWQAVHGEAAPPKYATYARRVTEGLHRAEAVVALTLHGARVLRAHYGVRGRVRVVPNGVELRRYEPRTKEPFVLTAGRAWDRAKNVDGLVRASADIAWPLFVAGDGDAPSGGQVGAVGTLGTLGRGDLGRWMSRAAVYAAPAYYEPFGLAVLEAALSGCALVLGDIPSLREIWGDAARWAAPGDGPAIAAAMRALIEDPPLRARLAERARSRAREFAIERTASAYLAIYGELAGAEWAVSADARERSVA